MVVWLACAYAPCGCGGVEVIGAYSSEDLANAACGRYQAMYPRWKVETIVDDSEIDVDLFYDVNAPR